MFEIGKKGTPEAGPRPESSPARMDPSPPRSTSSAPASRDAAVAITLPPGGYTVTVSGREGTAGTALVEIYDLDR